MSLRLLILALTCCFAPASEAQWILQHSGTTAGLRGIHSLGSSIAWASGTGGTVLRTTDGGETWQHCSIPPGAEGLDFRGIQAFDAKTAFVMSSGKGAQSRVYKTTDECHSWRLVFTNPDPDGFWDALQFENLNAAPPANKCFGLILGDPVANHFTIFETYDCGETWERQKILPEATPNEGAFAASNSSLIVGGSVDRAFVTGGASGSRIVKMADRIFDNPDHLREKNINPFVTEIGTWVATTLPLKHPSDSTGAFSICWIEEDFPVIVGGDYQKPDVQDDSAWYMNLDSREHEFKQADKPPGGFRSAVAYHLKSRVWIAVGPNGTDISDDAGRHWRPLQPDPKKGDAVDADRNWNALSLPFVVGPKGRIGRLREDALKPTLVR